MGKLKILTDGLVKENPMGFAATFVLVCSNIAISALRKVIPGQVRLPAYITVIATFVTIVQNLVKAYFPDLDAALGVYLPLIVVNCIILGRAEMFASKNGVVDSALDGVGMGLGFTLALLLMSTIREVLGAGTWYGIQIIPESIDRFTFMTSPAGGFFTFGLLMALVVFIETKLGDRRKRSVGCEGCPSKGACGAKGGCE